MNKFIASLMILFCSVLPAFAQNMTLNRNLVPALQQQDFFPSISATPVRMPTGAILAATNSTTFTAVGQWSSSPVGTATNAIDANGNWANYATGVTAGNSAGICCLNYYLEAQQLPRFIATVKTGPSSTDIASTVIWVGLLSNTNFRTTATSVLNVAAFRYAPSTPDSTAFWRVVTANGTTVNTIITTVPVAANTEYTMAIDCTGSSYVFYINGVAAATTNVDLPVSSTVLNPCVWIYNPTSGTHNLKLKSIWTDNQ